MCNVIAHKYPVLSVGFKLLVHKHPPLAIELCHVLISQPHSEHWGHSASIHSCLIPCSCHIGHSISDVRTSIVIVSCVYDTITLHHNNCNKSAGEGTSKFMLNMLVQVYTGHVLDYQQRLCLEEQLGSAAIVKGQLCLC